MSLFENFPTAETVRRHSRQSEKTIDAKALEFLKDRILEFSSNGKTKIEFDDENYYHCYDFVKRNEKDLLELGYKVTFQEDPDLGAEVVISWAEDRE